MATVIQLSESQWTPLDCHPAALLVPGWRELSERLAITFEEYDEDGLGRAMGALLKTHSGIPFIIRVLLQAPTDFEYVCIDTAPYGDRARELQEILSSCGIARSELRWVNEEIKLPLDKPTKEEVAAQFKRTAENYARSAGHANGADLGILLKLLAPTAQMRVLDIATGTGFTAAAIAPFVCEVTAADLVPEMIAQTEKLFKARALANVKTKVCDAEALSFDDASFDAVTVRIAPHHFLDIAQALSEVARVLRPGGVFIMEDSCAPAARRSDRFINDLEKLRDPTHVRSYTKREWKALLKQSGLKFVRLRNYRKQHDIADWVERSGLPADQQAKVHAAFASAPAWARKAFSITFEAGRAVSYSDDKIILRAVKE
ncbi:MAG TPA: class I SAM-dependent methyltransferase [Planktothrix sp.]